MKRKLVRLKDNQKIMEKDGEILVSRSYYEVVPTTETVQVFTGHTLPIPYSLVIYLNANELKIFVVIFDRLRETGHCFFSSSEFGRRAGISSQSAYTSLVKLRKMGIVYNKRYGMTTDKQIDYRVVQKIEELCQRFGAVSIPLFRKELRLVSPFDVSQRMIANVKNRLVKKVVDPIEDEEYI